MELLRITVHTVIVDADGQADDDQHVVITLPPGGQLSMIRCEDESGTPILLSIYPVVYRRD